MLVVPAFAKVNLALEVVGRRGDGFHEIASVVVTVDWHDLVGLGIGAPDRAGPDPAGVVVSGPGARQVPAGQANLAARALAELVRLAGVSLPISLWLDKQLPTAAGLGGGSADAAAALRAGARLLAGRGRRLDPGRLHAAAASLGSDVPVLLRGGGASLVGGRGERLVPLLGARRLDLAVAVVAPSSTAAAYAALSPAEIGARGRSDRLAGLLDAGDQPPDQLLGSALEPAARRAAPALADGLDGLRAAVPQTGWHLTGSGGAAFCLAADRADAVRLAAAAHRAGFPARPCRTIPEPAGALWGEG